jgi:hypothetical protein
MDDKAREAFEAKWPMPENCTWTGSGYAPTAYGAWDAQAYVQRWEGFCAALQWAASQQAAEGWKLLKNTTLDERTWHEDEGHENGNYFCNCIECGRQFIGHKRRVICKSCAAPPATQGGADA